MNGVLKKETKPKRVRMEEVAKIAGVSLATVSRALRDTDMVSESLRKRVREVSDRLGYSPNPIAGSLSGKHAPLIGVVVSSITNSFFAGTLESMASVLEPEGFQLMISHHEYDLEREARIVSAFAGWNPSALVVTGVDHTRTTTSLLSAATCPVVEMWDLDGRPLDTMIGFSNVDAGRVAARHFIDSGFRRVAFVGAILDRDPRARARSKGFADEFERRGVGQASLIQVDGRELGKGCEALRSVLELQPNTEAIAFSGDMLAVGALLEMDRLGIKVPDDIALLGYGDLDIAPFTNPALSTIRPPRHEIGEVVARHILKRLKDPKSGGETLDLGVDVVVRGTG